MNTRSFCRQYITRPACSGRNPLSSIRSIRAGERHGFTQSLLWFGYCYICEGNTRNPVQARPTEGRRGDKEALCVLRSRLPRGLHDTWCVNPGTIPGSDSLHLAFLCPAVDEWRCVASAVSPVLIVPSLRPPWNATVPAVGRRSRLTCCRNKEGLMPAPPRPALDSGWHRTCYCSNT